MKKFKVFVFLLLVSAFLGACTINANTDPKNLTYPEYSAAMDEEDTNPLTYEIETVVESLEEPVIEIRDDYDTASNGASWIYAKVQDGTQGYQSAEYRKVFNQKGELLSRVLIPDSNQVVATTNTVIANGQRAQSGAYFDATKITRYGVDCAGCGMSSEGRGGTASGIAVGLDEVRQMNGTWQKGVTYEGYYIVATSSEIPFCTILKISDHGISGSGITPGVPFYAIVLDRGGAINGTKLDIYAGSQKAPLVTQTPTRGAHVEIISLNARTRVNGNWACDL